jgi:hypothetical protein
MALRPPPITPHNPIALPARQGFAEVIIGQLAGAPGQEAAAQRAVGPTPRDLRPAVHDPQLFDRTLFMFQSLNANGMSAAAPACIRMRDATAEVTR